MYGIIGYGYAGRATAMLLDKYKSYVIDKDYGSYSEMLSCEPEVVFICVPTPGKEDGNLDESIVTEVLVKLQRDIEDLGIEKIKVVIRSTLDPIALEIIHSKYSKNMDIAFIPEFLREDSYIDDAISKQRIIISVFDENQVYAYFLQTFIRYGTSNTDITFSITDARSASLAKLATNAYLATKVTFCNELRSICPDIYDEVIDLVTDDERISKSHIDVPGKHGFGYSGKCLPKDTNALYKYSTVMRENGSELLGSVIDINNSIRGNE